MYARQKRCIYNVRILEEYTNNPKEKIFVYSYNIPVLNWTELVNLDDR